MALQPSKSYAEFLTRTLRPVRTPPKGEDCAICCLGLVGENLPESSQENSAGTAAQADIPTTNIANGTQSTSITHDAVVKVRHCGHIYHRDCICTWITEDMKAPTPRRSCPSCRTELIRFGIESRAEALSVRIHEADKTVTELGVTYQAAREPLRVLQELEPKIAVIMEEWRAKEDRCAKLPIDRLFTQLRGVFKENEPCDEDDLDFTYLAQLLLDGHSVAESIKPWHITRLETTRSIFKAESTRIHKRAEPLIIRRIDKIASRTSTLLRTLYTEYGLSEEEARRCVVYHFNKGKGRLLTSFPTRAGEEGWDYIMNNTGVHLYNLKETMDWALQMMDLLKHREKVDLPAARAAVAEMRWNSTDEEEDLDMDEEGSDLEEDGETYRDEEGEDSDDQDSVWDDEDEYHPERTNIVIWAIWMNLTP